MPFSVQLMVCHFHPFSSIFQVLFIPCHLSTWTMSGNSSNHIRDVNFLFRVTNPAESPHWTSDTEDSEERSVGKSIGYTGHSDVFMYIIFIYIYIHGIAVSTWYFIVDICSTLTTCTRKMSISKVSQVMGMIMTSYWKPWWWLISRSDWTPFEFPV